MSHQKICGMGLAYAFRMSNRKYPWLLAAVLLSVCLASLEATAGEASSPVANQKFFSLHAARNMAANKRTSPVSPPRFFALRKEQVVFPLAKKTAASHSAEAPPASPGSASGMTHAEAQQMLSLFGAPD